MSIEATAEAEWRRIAPVRPAHGNTLNIDDGSTTQRPSVCRSGVSPAGLHDDNGEVKV